MSLYFDGNSNNYLSIPNSADFRFGTGDFTIEFWLYSFGKGAGYARIFNFGIFDSWTLGVCYHPTLGIALYLGASPTASLFPDAVLSYNTWNHYVICRSGTTLRTFLDGALVTTVSPFTFNFNDSVNSLLIGNQATLTDPLGGYITNFRWVTGTALYTSPFIPSTAPLTRVSGTALLLLASSTSEAFQDSSSVANPKTVTSNGVVVGHPRNPFNNSMSMYFAGNSSSFLSVPNTADLRFGTGDFTIEWFQYAWATYSYGRVFALGPFPSTISVEWNTINDPNIAAYVILNGGTASYYPVTISGNIANIRKRWAHIAVTRSGTTLRFFVDGYLQATHTSTDNLTDSTNPLIIGGQSDGLDPTQRSYLGYINNFRVVKGTALYTANFTVPTAPLTAVSGTSLLLVQGYVDTNASPKTITNSSVTYTNEARYDFHPPLLDLPVPLTTDVVPWVWVDPTDITTTQTPERTLLGIQNKGTTGGSSYNTVIGTLRTRTDAYANGRPALSVPTGSYLLTDSITPTSNAYAIFFTVTFPPYSGSRPYITVFQGSGGNISSFIIYDSTSSFEIRSGFNGIANQVITRYSPPGGSVLGQTLLISIVASASSTNNNVITVNGVPQTLSTNALSSGSISASQFNVGANTSSDTQGATYGDIMVYQGELTATHRQKIEGYLAWKYGLQTSLPATHPYHPDYKDNTVKSLIRSRSVVTTFKSFGGSSVATDSKGNVFISTGGTISRITPAGVSTTYTALSGTGRIACVNDILYVPYNGTTIAKIRVDPNSSTPGEITYYAGVASMDFISADGNENMYVVSGSDLIKITPGDVRTTFLSGESPASLIEHAPSGYFYYPTRGSRVIKKVPIAGGTGTVVAGVVGSAGTADGFGSDARFNVPYYMDLGPDGNFYVMDAGERIRRVTPAGVVTTVVGTTTPGYTDGGDLIAQFTNAFAITVAPDGTMYVIEDVVGGRTRKISLGALHDVRTVASGLDSYPTGCVLDGNGNLYTASFNGTRLIQRTTSQGVKTTFATPSTSTAGLAIDVYGNIFNTNSVGGTLDKYSLAGAKVVYGGIGSTGAVINAYRSGARFGSTHYGIVFDSQGNMLSADGAAIRKITPLGYTSTFVPSGTMSASLFPAITGDDTLYVPDPDQEKIWKITSNGTITVFAGSGTAATTDGFTTSAAFNGPAGIIINDDGVMYVSELQGQVIRRITTDGYVATVAGTAGVSGSADGVGTAATFGLPHAMAITPYGELLVTGASENMAIRVVSINRIPTSVVIVSGIPEVGLGLTSSSTISDPDGTLTSVYTYQWQSSDTSTGTYANIDGATSSSYTPASSLFGKYLRVAVNYTDDRGTTEQVVSDGYGPVAAPNLKPYFTIIQGTRLVLSSPVVIKL